MNETIFANLIARGTVEGRDATDQDFADAIRVVNDQATTYYQLDDQVGEALCCLALRQLLAARIRHRTHGSLVPF
jgi:hypothetical protein